MLRSSGYPDAGRLILAAVLSLCAGVAAAADTPEAVPLSAMSAEEYAVYREQLRQRVKEAEGKEAESEDGKQTAATDEEDAAKQKEKSSGSGYGMGYRSRMERSGGSGGAYRGGGMSRGGGGRGR